MKKCWEDLFSLLRGLGRIGQATEEIQFFIVAEKKRV